MSGFPKEKEPAQPVVIRATGLSKAYAVYRKPVDMLKEALFGMDVAEKYWALRDVNVEIRKGEVIGFLGPNGSGKSTLLRILAGKLDATSGEVEVNGHVHALFELGTGFNMEMTGRDNIYQLSLYRGLTVEQIDRLYDDIVDFSELEGFLDQPVKTYSNGMKARLAFSAAIVIDPEILFVDEVLGVGDEAFSAKCSERMRQICSSGATVLIVTHSTAYVQRLCDRAYYFENGRVLKEGSANDIARLYDTRMLERSAERAALKDGATHRGEIGAPDQRTVAGRPMSGATGDLAGHAPAAAAPGTTFPPGVTRDETGRYGFGRLEISSSDPVDARVFRVGGDLQVAFTLFTRDSVEDILIGLQLIRTADSIVMASVHTGAIFDGSYSLKEWQVTLEPGENRFAVTFPKLSLGAGTYTLCIGFGRRNRSTWGAERLAFFKDVGAFSIYSEGERQFVAVEPTSVWRRMSDPAIPAPDLVETSGTP